MKKSFTEWLDPILLIGLFISISIAAFLVWIGNDQLSGFIVGLLSTIITLLVDIVSRLQKAEKNFIDAAGLENILSNPRAINSIREQADLYGKIYSFKFQHYNRITEIITTEFQMRLAELASGEVAVPTKTDLEYSGKIGMNEVQREVKVIHIGNMDFWRRSFSKIILNSNKQAIDRHVCITRIFAISLDEVQTYNDLLQQQSLLGIRVLIIDPKRVAKEFTVFDDRIVVEYDVVEGDYRQERIILDPAKVKRKIQEFDFLVGYAQPLSDIHPAEKDKDV